MKHLTYLIAAMMLFAVSQTAQGAVLDSCDQWASYCSGGYCVYNAVWNPQGSWSQCITAQSTTQWSCNATHPSNGVKSYPNSSREPLGVSIGSITSLSSTVSAGSGPGSGDWNLAYDLWAPEEIMIWLQWNGAVGIWGSYVTTATIGGRTYDVYKNGYPGFMVQTQMTGGTFNIKAILDYCVSQGWCSNSGILANVQCGYEITGASNLTFSMNSYSVSIESTEPIENPPEPPPPSETPTTGVWYKVLAGHSGKPFEVADASTSDGANVQQWSDDGGTNQQWMLETVGSYYRFINRNSSLCLQVEGWSTADGGNVNQGTVGDDYQNNQHWSLTKDGDWYQIINRNSGKLVDVSSCSVNNGTNIHQWSYYSDGAESQRWSFQTVGGATTSTTTTAATTSTTTTAATTSTTTTAATTSTTTTAAAGLTAYYCDVDAMSSSLPMTVGGNLNSKTEATSSQYSAIASSDNTRWTTSDPGRSDEVFLWLESPVTETGISSIDLTFEGYLNNSSATFSIWARDVANGEWDQIGSTQSISTGSDGTMTRSITSDIANYISGQTLIWGVYESTSSQSLNIDYVNVVVNTGGTTTTTTTAATTSTTTTAATTSTTTTAATTSTTTTAATTSTTSTTTTSGGSCDCGTCNWWGTNIPMCCESCSGWGWYDGGCRRSCVCPSSCEGGSVP